MVVDEVFSGTVEVGGRMKFSQIAIGEMGASPKAGERYFIYAHSPNGTGFGLGVCSGSQRLEWAGEDVAYARALAGELPEPSFRGVVAEMTWPLYTDAKLAGVRVVLSGDSGKHEAVTDGAGEFQFGPLPPGEYHAEAFHPGYKVRAMYNGPVVHVPPSGCAHDYIVMEPVQ